MNEDADIDYEIAADEESLKIRRLERELESISVSEDKRLFLFLGAGLVVIFFYALSPGPITEWLVILVVPLSVFGGLGFVIFQNIRRKRQVLIKHGLQCREGGFIPSLIMASGVLGSRKCPKCASPLHV